MGEPTLRRALRLFRVCVCGHDRAAHDSPHSMPYRPEVTRCQWVDWVERDDPNDVRARAHCACMWWRPLLIPRLRRVVLERPMVLKRAPR